MEGHKCDEWCHFECIKYNPTKDITVMHIIYINKLLSYTCIQLMLPEKKISSISVQLKKFDASELCECNPDKIFFKNSQERGNL